MDKKSTMQNISRRNLLKSLGLGAAGAALAACTPPATTEPAKGGSPAQTAPAAAQKVEIIFHARSGTNGDYYAAEVEKFQKSVDNKIAVKLELTPAADFLTKLATLAAGGTLGDSYFNYVFGVSYPFAANGIALTLDSILAADKDWDASRFFSAPYDLCKWKGKMFGVPSGGHAGWSAFTVNTDLFEKAGAPLPKWEWSYEKEYLDSLKTVQAYLDKTPDNKKKAYMFEYIGQNALLYILSFGGDWIDPKDTSKATLTNEKTMAALQYMRDLVVKHKVSPKRSEVVDNAFQNQIFGSVSTGIFNYGLYKSTVKDFKWQMFPAPAGPNNTRGSFIGVDPLCINAKSTKTKEIMQWFKWLVFNKEAVKAAAEGNMSPTSVKDYWKEAPFAGNPSLESGLKWLEAAKPWTLPGNARVAEFNQTFNSGLESLMNEANDFNAEIKKLQDKVQAVLNQPQA